MDIAGQSARLEGARASVGVVVVAYSSDDVLPAFLESVCGDPLVGSIVVVDNAPQLGASSVIAGRYGAAYVGLAGNPGYGAAINAGVEAIAAEFEWLLLCNPDLVISTGAIGRLLSVATSDLDIAAVGPSILDEESRVYPSAREIPSLRTGIGHALFADLWPTNPWSRRYRRDDASEPSTRETGWLSGACLLVNRRFFIEVGGFDEGYFMYFEDVDLGLRFDRMGLRNVYAPSAEVTHRGGHSTSQNSKAMIKAHHGSAIRFLGRRYPGALLSPLRLALRAGLVARSAIQRRRNP